MRQQFEFTIPMALEDYLPVIFSAFGLYLIVKTLSVKQANVTKLAGLGALLIVTDGFLKATWKLIYAAAGVDVAWMKDSLFLLMGPGFMMFSWALWKGLKEQLSTNRQIWLTPLIVVFIALILAGYLVMMGRSSRPVLLTLTTFGTVWMAGQLILSSWRKGLYLAVFLFFYNVVTIFLQVWLAQLPQTTALQWLGQINNTFSWLAFAVGVWLWQRRKDNYS